MSQDTQIDVIDELFTSTLQVIHKVEQRALNTGPLRELSIAEVHTIVAIGMGPGRSMGDISAQLCITTATLTTAIHRLFRKGYVQRARDDVDRRIVRVTLTTNGRRAYRIHELYHKRLIRDMMEGYTPQQRDLFVEVIGKLNAFFTEESARMAQGDE